MTKISTFVPDTEINGKGNRPGGLIGLSIIGLFFVPYCKLLTKKYKR